MLIPPVYSEAKTINKALQGMSIARYGDGELRLAMEGSGTASSQREKPPMLMQELCAILAEYTAGLLVCLPDFHGHGPNRNNWRKYARPQVLKMFGKQEFGSAFITRPDNAPSINRPAYWELVRQLWRGKDITLVVGDKKSITLEMLQRTGARSVREVWGPRINAYAEIDRLEKEIGTPEGTVILCLGATATILAWRLARKGVHALDLGHVGMFMKRLGVEPEVVNGQG